MRLDGRYTVSLRISPLGKPSKSDSMCRLERYLELYACQNFTKSETQLPVKGFSQVSSLARSWSLLTVPDYLRHQEQ
jgi:hypothetical protein